MSVTSVIVLDTGPVTVLMIVMVASGDQTEQG